MNMLARGRRGWGMENEWIRGGGRGRIPTSEKTTQATCLYTIRYYRLKASFGGDETCFLWGVQMEHKSCGQSLGLIKTPGSRSRVGEVEEKKLSL